MALKTISLFTSILLFLLQVCLSDDEKKVVKSSYWFFDSAYPLSDIDFTFYTHLLCAQAFVDPNTFQLNISNSKTAQFSVFTQTLQQKNPSLKTLLSITGGIADDSALSSMARNASTRKTFIDSSITIGRPYNFHGLVLDWEFSSTTTDMTNLGLLFKEWREAVEKESKNSNKPQLLLTVAVYFSSVFRSLSYPAEAMENNLDWIKVMAFDFGAPTWKPNLTEAPAALYNPFSEVSGDSGISSWIRAGFPARKIVFGLPYYGYAWKLKDTNNHGFLAPANGADITADGALGYTHIRNRTIGQGSAITAFNYTFATDYCYNGTTWVGYDDVKSILAKVLYAKGKGLLGYFAWRVDLDDNWTLSKTV
uniref:GH18 domain-containing protein n=1 Tax=Quercus lobata TaxID=97700 RepID=A0A7N2L4L6_QUELO